MAYLPTYTPAIPRAALSSSYSLWLHWCSSAACTASRHRSRNTSAPSQKHSRAKAPDPSATHAPSAKSFQLDGSREPSSWKLFADGACVADGSGAFARECFCEGAEVFLDLCRDAVHAAELHQWSQREYELLSAARGIAGV